MKKWMLALVLFSSIYSIHAQNIFDAVRYSSFDASATTARSLGVGGTLGAFGGDFSSISTNPAGLGSYWTSEVIFAPAVPINTTSTFLQGARSNQDIKESKAGFGINTIGLVLNKRGREASNWKSINFAIGFQQLANFAGNTKLEGRSTGSITGLWADEAFNNIFSDFGNNLALETGAIIEETFTDSSGNVQYNYFTDFDIHNDNNPESPALPQRSQVIKTKGALNELSFALAGNLNNKLKLGITVGVPFVDYTEEKLYMESDVGNEIDVFNALIWQENLNTSGVGINAKLGIIYQASTTFRLGGAVHTPTGYTLTDNFSTDLVYDYTFGNNDGPVQASSPEGTFEYKFRTPWRFIANAGYLVGKKGFLAAEVEFINYTQAKFNLTSNTNDPFEEDNERSLNEDIDTYLDKAVNFKLGGEYVYNKFRFRAGFNISGIALAADSDVGTSFSLGTGYRARKYYVDLAYRFSRFDGIYTPYFEVDGTFGQGVSTENTSHRTVLTFGYKF